MQGRDVECVTNEDNQGTTSQRWPFAKHLFFQRAVCFRCMHPVCCSLQQRKFNMHVQEEKS